MEIAQIMNIHDNKLNKQGPIMIFHCLNTMESGNIYTNAKISHPVKCHLSVPSCGEHISLNIGIFCKMVKFDDNILSVLMQILYFPISK